ncbi:hydantoinase/oxoprolinase N-terminal domain-containing protein [Primorskyibacter sp. S87]|uniref:hydantoinase/oxoprolinase N-terminal domain-containing protein n=1 Tax=Primorskyibacter sp. S87 TaxID=3415126 RepID=UPI003C7C7678
MALALGVDTGGTYTDAVLVRDEKKVIASAKSLTTRSDLAIGIGNAVEEVLRQAQVPASEISIAALSTTLATNALVEGQGGRVALIYIGFQVSDLARHGVSDALKGDPTVVLQGGHDHAGIQKVDLDEAGLIEFLHKNNDVSGYAVAAQFATRNPEHENRAAEIIRDVTGIPVTCSHHLSAKLNGPKRAVTAVLNARLIGMIDKLIGRAGLRLTELGVTAPLMVVRGDGALMSAEQARTRPIETILSGPAASVVGARWLTGVDQAIVSDIGGTTTDVALIRDGRPAIDPNGAQVGPFRTMVEAVAMRTTGLGGDSQVHVRTEGLIGGVTLGPRRVVPVSLMAIDASDVVHAKLDEQLRNTVPGEHDGQFLRRVPGSATEGLGPRELTLLDRIGTDVCPAEDALRSRMDHASLKRLIERGVVQISGVTPSDASHVLGTLAAWDSEAAHKSLVLFSRKKTGAGNSLASDPTELANMICDQLTERTSLALLETAFSEESESFDLPPGELASHVLMQRGLASHRGLLSLDAALNIDVVGLGASAPNYYPTVGDRLRSRVILPEHAGVANAIGAVVGRITVRRAGTITSPAEGQFRVHLEFGPKDFSNPEAAQTYLEESLSEQARSEARQGGAEDIRLLVERQVQTAQIEARDVFVGAEITVEASGRPRVAVG